MYDTWNTGYSAATITLGSVEEAEKVIAAMHKIHIEYEGSDDYGTAAGGADEWKPPVMPAKALKAKFFGAGGKCEKMYVMNLPGDTTEGALRELVTSLDLTVEACKVLRDKMGHGYVVAVVTLASPDEAETAIAKLSGQVIESS